MAALRAATTATYGTADRREDCILLATAIYVSANEAYEAKIVQERAERISGRTPAKFGDYSGLREAHEEARARAILIGPLRLYLYAIMCYRTIPICAAS